ncbi:MAG: hypothetical protein COU90_01195 [Candidatus Ryanbacteria bacterium CG10_big_fil_rev_8_21_14_0_10_43_42]|uniref:Metal-dependent hydrolase n=1 Tax=Candidatus Ryanbacteria bacterium CG10_big_fil_rev_8_21_14_0_10_43_42 TaxID=1974864 RepID=A0A2M8KY85_9BACT|nr:MAG: hypothetical protein COU90_01195 [Candidatus Ryanbacteria bacterium CG10_big_fil_rev_8_21_14_0_10_43_42]
MFIAHFPAGYILTKKLQEKQRVNKYLWLGLVASILPDIDLLWFYLVDNRQTLHHDYWLHVPIFWVGIFVIWYLFLLISKQLNQKYLLPTVIFFTSITLHLLLDTIAGGIAWFYPFSDTSFVLIDVPAKYGWWVWNFVFHWSFLLELGIILWAITVFSKSQGKK